MTATSNANAQSVVSWTAPASNGGAAITSYTATSSARAAHLLDRHDQLHGDRPHQRDQLHLHGHRHQLGRHQCRVGGVGGGHPGHHGRAPTGVTAVATSSATTASVSWTTPASNGGAAITSYTVTSSPGRLDLHDHHHQLHRAGLTTGPATPTPWPPSTRPAPVPPRPRPTPWSPAHRAPTGVIGHLQRQRPVGGVLDRTGRHRWLGHHLLHRHLVARQLHLLSATTSCTVAGLTNGTSYTFTVTATNVDGTGPASAASAAAIPATTPGAPTGVTATSNANTQSVVSWTAPASNGGSAITGYTVTSSPGGFTCSTATTSCTVTGLTNGTSYTFTVTATNGVGAGPASAASAAAIPATTPGAPTGVTATAYHVGDLGGHHLDGSGQQRRHSADRLHGDVVACGHHAGRLLDLADRVLDRCTFTGLTAGTTYTFTVTATNAVGTGAASAASNSITMSGRATRRAVGRIGHLGDDLDHHLVGDPAVNGGSALTGYTVRRRRGHHAQPPARPRSPGPRPPVPSPASPPTPPTPSR